MPPEYEVQEWMSRRNAELGRNVVDLYPGMRGFFVEGKYQTKANDSANTPRQLFVRLGDDGQESGTHYFDPHGKFTNMADPRYLDTFISDPDTFDPRNPSGFEKSIFDVLQNFKDNPQALHEYVKQNPSFGVWKQETAR